MTLRVNNPNKLVVPETLPRTSQRKYSFFSIQFFESTFQSMAKVPKVKQKPVFVQPLGS